MQTIGDGTATTITLTHNLNSRNVVVSVKRSSTHAEVECDVVAATVNTVTLTFATAPTTNEFYATVISAGASTVSNAISSPIVTSSGNSLTLPTTNDTLVGRETTDTLKNKTLSGSGSGANTFQNIPTSALSINGATMANVAALETITGSNAWVDGVNSGDSVTVSVGATGKVLVGISGMMRSSNAGSEVGIGFAISGANTSVVNGAWILSNSYTGQMRMSGVFMPTGLNTGSTTFKMKLYTPSAVTGYFSDRSIWVIPL